MKKLPALLLMPFSWLYALVTDIRNRLFDSGMLRSERFPVPVLSIGNITVGGTGKTPHVALLCTRLSAGGRVAVLSRGYGRKTRGFRLVTPDTLASEAGDEPCMLKRRCPQALVAVDEQRVHGIRTLLRLPEPPDVILLDDAFQHRYVRPSWSVLLADFNRPLYRDRVLPAGRMRERFAGRLRADMVLLTKCPPDFTAAACVAERARFRLPETIPFLATSFRYGALCPVFPEASSGPLAGRRLTDAVLEGWSVLVVTAIACPELLHRAVRPAVAQMDTLRFADHHAFSSRNAAALDQAFRRLPDGPRCIFTTEKDAVRWQEAPLSASLRAVMYAVPVEVCFPLHDDDIFWKAVNRQLSSECTGHEA